MNTENTFESNDEDGEQDRVPFMTQEEMDRTVEQAFAETEAEERVALEALTVARVQYAPQDSGPVAVVRISNYEATGGNFEVFFDGGFWGDGEETKYFESLTDAMQAIGREFESLLAEEETV